MRVGAEAAVGGRAVIVHGEDEVDGVAEREDHTLEAERVADVLETELRILGEDDWADGLGEDRLLSLSAALGADEAVAGDE